MNKINSQTEASIDLFLRINSKLTLQNVLKQKIDNIFTWLDLDDSVIKALIKGTTLHNTTFQEIVISVFNIHYKLFGSGMGEDRITTKLYKSQTVPEMIQS